MHNITDYITLGVFGYLFYNGWSKGFLKTLIGPISLIIGAFVSYGYFKSTQNIFMSLSICVFGPLLISIALSFIYTQWRKHAEGNLPPSLPSRVSASAFSILWGGAYLMIMLLLIGISPFEVAWFKNIQDDVLASKTYDVIDSQFGNKISDSFIDIKKVTNILRDPEKLKSLESSEELQALREDERLKALFSDKEIANQIENKDYSALMSNPEIQALLSDKELFGKIFALNKRISQETLDDVDAETGPLIIDINQNQKIPPPYRIVQ